MAEKYIGHKYTIPKKIIKRGDVGR